MSEIPANLFPAELLAMRSHADLVRGVERMRDDTVGFFQELSPEVFFARPTSGWSPAQNLAHLIKSIRPVRLALHLPRFVYFFFGRGRESVGPEDVIQRYLGVLGTGYQAGFSYRPGSAGAPDGQESAASRARDKMLGVYAAHCDGLLRVLGNWSEADLDRYRMPHPAVGKISVREMSYFTVFHPYHHMHKIRARMK